jgi:hypothetical protein
MTEHKEGGDCIEVPCGYAVKWPDDFYDHMKAMDRAKATPETAR